MLHSETKMDRPTKYWVVVALKPNGSALRYITKDLRRTLSKLAKRDNIKAVGISFPRYTYPKKAKYHFYHIVSKEEISELLRGERVLVDVYFGLPIRPESYVMIRGITLKFLGCKQ